MHQALVMHVAPVERGGIHLPPKKQNSLVQSESPMHSTQRPLSQIVASPRVQSELATHVFGGGLVGLGGLGGLGQPSTMVSVAMIRIPKVSRPRMFAND